MSDERDNAPDPLPLAAEPLTAVLQWAHDRGREAGFEEGYEAAGRAVHDWNRDHGNAPAEAADG